MQRLEKLLSAFSPREEAKKEPNCASNPVYSWIMLYLRAVFLSFGNFKRRGLQAGWGNSGSWIPDLLKLPSLTLTWNLFFWLFCMGYRAQSSAIGFWKSVSAWNEMGELQGLWSNQWMQGGSPGDCWIHLTQSGVISLTLLALPTRGLPMLDAPGSSSCPLSIREHTQLLGVSVGWFKDILGWSIQTL